MNHHHVGRDKTTDKPPSYKFETRQAYDRYASQMAHKFRQRITSPIMIKSFDDFLKFLPGTKILDLGAGAGDHAVYFKQRGLTVHCLDNSPNMIALCRSKGLEADIGDIENLQLARTSYDGIWAYASLIHIPRDTLVRVVTKITALLKPGGILGLAVKEGSTEGLESDPRYQGVKRWFTYFTDQEIKGLMSPHFIFLDQYRDVVNKKTTFLHSLLRKK